MKIQRFLMVPVLASIGLCGHAAADANCNVNLFNNSVTFVFGSPANHGIKVHCESHGDVNSRAGAGLSCSADFEPKDKGIITGSSLPMDECRENAGPKEKFILTNGAAALVTTEEATRSGSAIVRIIVTPRI